MTRFALALACLALLLAPSQAWAKYRIPPAHELLGASELIVVGKVEAVAEDHYQVVVVEQLAGPKQALKGRLRIHRRPRVRACVPQDPEGIAPGSTWIWILYPERPAPAGQPAAPYLTWVHGIVPVREGRVRMLARQSGPAAERYPTLAQFKELVAGLRASFRFQPGKAPHQLASEAELKAFAARSAFAAELVAEVTSLRR